MSEEIPQMQMRVDAGGGRERTVPVDLPSNSRKSKERKQQEREKRAEKVITGEVVQRRKGLLGRIGGNIIAEGSGSIIEYLVMEVLIPAAKTTILDLLNKGGERALYGDDARYRSRSDRPGFNYAGVRRPTSPQYGVIGARARAVHDFDDIILATRGEAEDVLDSLRDLIDQYDQASVSDLYDLVGITSNFTDEKWGWYDLRAAQVRHVRGGYLISLPRTQPLEN